jgi:uncharacterized protein (DUF3820 family)
MVKIMNKLNSFKDLKILTPVESKAPQEIKKIADKLQVKLIQAVLNKERRCPDYRFNFGKHKGELLEKVVKEDREYLLWLLNEDFVGDRLTKIFTEALSFYE